MSGKRDSNEEPHPERKIESHLPIMGLGSEEFQPPTSCFDFPNILVGKKESQEKYPPIVTIDGRVDTDIDHLIDEEEDYTGPVVEIPSKFPKPHIFSVVDGSLDDDIDNYLNDDGTIEHTLVDAPKNFNPSELKDVASKDNGLDLATRRSTEMPLTNRSYNKTHVENSENDVTNEMAEGELSINVGSQELGADDEPSEEEPTEAGARQDIAAEVSYEKMNTSDGSVTTYAGQKRDCNLELKPAKSVDSEGIGETQKMLKKEVDRDAVATEGPTTKLSKENEPEVRKRPSSSAVDGLELFERGTFSSPSEHFIGREIERCHTVIYCQEDAAGRGDSVLSTLLTADKDFNLPKAEENIHVKPEDVLQSSQVVFKMPAEVPTQQGPVEGLLHFSEKVNITEIHHPQPEPETESEEKKMKELESDVVVGKTNQSVKEEMIGAVIPNVEVSQMKCSDRAKDDLKTPPVEGAGLLQVPIEDKKSCTSSRTPSIMEPDNSDSDIDISESLALLSKLEEFKGDKQKTKELLNQFKQLVLDNSQTRQDRASKSESVQSSLTETLHKMENNSQDEINESGKLADQPPAHNESQKCETERHQGDNASAMKPEGNVILKLSSDSAKNNLDEKSNCTKSETKEEQGIMPDPLNMKLKELSPLPLTIALPTNNDQKENLHHTENAAKPNGHGSDERQQSHHNTSGVGPHEEKRGAKGHQQMVTGREQGSRCMDENDSRKDDRIGSGEKQFLREHRSANRKADKTLQNLTEPDKPDTQQLEGVSPYKNNEEKSQLSCKKIDKHLSHLKEKKKDNRDPTEQPAGVEHTIEDRHHNPQDQKSAHKCSSFVGLNGDNVSPKNRSPRPFSGASPPLGETERNPMKKKRDRTSSMESTKRWRSTERKEKQINDKDDLLKQCKKDKNQSIKESLKVAIKVAEESMSAAAKVARALSFVIEATKPKMNLDTSTDEEGLQQSYDKLMDTMNTLSVSKPSHRSQSVSPSKRRDRSVDKTINQVAMASSLHGHMTGESESAIHRDKQLAPKEHRRKDKASNDFERKQSSSQLAPTSVGRNSDTQNVYTCAPLKSDKKETDSVTVVRTKLSDTKSHRPEESKVKASEAKNAPPEDKQRSAEIKHRTSEDKHARGKTADVRHRTDSESRRKSDEVKGKNEERKPKPEKSDRTRQERSTEGRHRVLDTKKSSEILKESKKEKSHEAVHKDSADAHKVIGRQGHSAVHHQSHSITKDKIPPEPATQHVASQRSHKTEHKEETGDGVKAVQKQVQAHSKPPMHAQQNQDQTLPHKEARRAAPHHQEGPQNRPQHHDVALAQPHDQLQLQDVATVTQTKHQEVPVVAHSKTDNIAPKSHTEASEIKTEEPKVHDWRIPLTKHNVNRKSESYFEQVTLPKPIGDEKASKVLIRRLLRGSRVDMLDSEASETDSLEYDSNFNRVLNHRVKSDSVLRRQEKSQGGRSRHAVEDHEHVTVLNTRDASVEEWHQGYYYEDEYWSSSQETIRDDIQTSYSYRASSQFNERKRSTSAHGSEHRKVTAVPRPDPHRAPRHHTMPSDQVPPPEMHRSCPVRLKSSDPQCCESDSLTSSHGSVLTVSSSGPKISLLKQNIMTHQLPFPQRKKGADQRHLRDGVMFSPIYEEETDVLSSVESGSWWQPSTEFNTNNGNVYDSAVDDMGSDVDGPAKVVVNVGQDLKTGPATARTVPDGKGALGGPTVQNNLDVELIAADEMKSDLTAADELTIGDEVNKLEMTAGIELTGDEVNKPQMTAGIELTGNEVNKPQMTAGIELTGNEVNKPQMTAGSELTEDEIKIALTQRLDHKEMTSSPSLEMDESQREMETKEDLESNVHQSPSESIQQVEQLNQSQDVYKEQDYQSPKENWGGIISTDHQESNIEELDNQMEVPDHGASFGNGHKTTYFNERQTSPDKPVPEPNDQYPLRIKQETQFFKNRTQQLSDQTMCSHLVDISKGSGTVDSWLRRTRSASVGVSARNRLRQQELITMENVAIVKRLLNQETVYSMEEQLLDHERKFFKVNSRFPDDSQKKLDGSDEPSASDRANYLAHEQAKAIDELYSKGKSNNRLRRTLSLPPIRKRSVTTDNVKSTYSRDDFEKDYQDHCIKLLLISKQPVDRSTRMTLKAHIELANRLEEREKRVRLATQKIDEMCKNRQPPYAPRPKSKT
ncbi:hypothetical protein Btru_072083 [Bulinus truncatus]|nr:hypothetical protein Btru_072083 [Bulinus truncatus]